MSFMKNIMKHDLTQVPNSPGCYIWLSKDGEVLYVGKAKNLKKRMLSYMKPSRATVTLLMNETFSYEFITTKTELDSLILEQTLINKYEPKYNIRIKYSSTYPYIKIDTRNGIKISLANRFKKIKGVKYYGPFPQGYGVSKIIKMINELFPTEKCLEPDSGKPCLNYQMGRCLGYCIKKVANEEIQNYLIEIVDFFKGNILNVKKKIINKIEVLSNKEKFEEAIKYREFLELVSKYSGKHSIQFSDSRNVDIFGWVLKEDFLSISIGIVRFGNLVGMENHIVKSYSSSIESEVETFIQLYYNNHVNPDYIYIQKYIQTKNKSKIPKKGNALKILEEVKTHSSKKVESSINILKIKEKRFNDSINELKKITKLSKLSTIELFDVSSTMGSEQVGVVVSYKNGNKYTNGYRKYVIKTIDKMDDYASMEELAYRHFKSKIANGETMPDLFIVDGKHQVEIVRKVLITFKLDVNVIGSIKNEKHDTDSIYVEGKIIQLKEKSPLYLLIGNMQDEVHRFAINFHRSRRKKNLIKTELSLIKILTKEDINKLFNTFGSIRQIKISSQKELEKIIGIKKAKVIIKHFEN